MRIIHLLILALLLSGCLPDDSEISINQINRKTHIENVARSLASTAQDYSRYLVESNMKRRTPLADETILSEKTEDLTITNIQKPVPPDNVHVGQCGDYGAIAYFTAIPKGVGSLLQNGTAMAASLIRSSFLDADSIGMKMATTIQLPKKGIELGCTVGNDIADGSPIVVVGFNQPEGMVGMPDPSKVTEPVFTREISVPCPSGTNGAIAREQVCYLKSKDNEVNKESGSFVVDTTSNEFQRKNRYWECTPDLASPLSPPSNEEVTAYCHDSANDIIKHADDAVATQIINIKDALEKNDPNASYIFFCRPKKDGSNTCEAKPYTPPAETYLVCDQDTPLPRFVLNPNVPLQLNAQGEVIGDAGAVRDCGRGWSGKMTARYLARRCKLMKTNNDDTTSVISTAQTIYRIGYAQGQCERDIETTVACPANIPGSDPNRRLPVMRHARMLKPVALDWSEYSPSPGAWDNTQMAGTDSRAEVLLTAAMSAPNKSPAVVPAITRGELGAISDNRIWSETLVDAMRKSDPTSIEAPIVSCNNSGDPCGIGVPNNAIEIWVDTFPLQNHYSGGDFELPVRTCTITGNRCNPLLGDIQPTICGGGQCLEDGVARIWGSNFEEYLGRFIETVKNPLPPDNTLTRVDPATSLPMLNDPNVICQLASSTTPRIIIFAHFDEYQPLKGPTECPALAGKTYLSIRDMIDDAADVYKRRGGDLLLFANHITLGNEGQPVHHEIRVNDIMPGGIVSETLSNWFVNPIPRPNPCSYVN